MTSQEIQERLAAFDCDHEVTHPTRAIKSNGVVCVYLQCQRCGEKTKETRKADHDVPNLPPFDDEKKERYREQRRRLWEEYHEQRQAEFNTKTGEFWNNYTAYLRTPEWQQVRRRALVRDNFTCQNCFVKVTDYNAHAHHLTYDSYKRIGVTFTFEVVTLCPACHNAFHEG